MEPFLGEIRLFPYFYAPKGWAGCDATVLQINHNQALFALLGTSFGGDGQTSFALPDLRGKAPLPSPGAYYIAIQGSFPERN